MAFRIRLHAFSVKKPTLTFFSNLLFLQYGGISRFEYSFTMARPSTRSVTEAGSRAGVVPSSQSASSIICNDRNPNLIHKNQMVILQLEQLGILAPGVLSVDSKGTLSADLSTKEQPDNGTMAGLFPAQSTEGIEEQIPSWLRDYLVTELDVYGCGPPAACAALYDHLKKSQDDVGINTSVKTAGTLLRCAIMSLQHSIQDIREFVDSDLMVEDTYDLEVGMVVRTVKRLINADTDCKDKKLPRDIHLLLDIGSMGVGMKSAMEASLQSLVVEPYSKLVEKLEMVAKGLQRDAERQHEEDTAEDRKSENEFGSDSGVDGC